MKLGKVYGDGGLLQEGFLSFTADRLLPIRGSKKTTYKGKCSTCRRYRYLPKHPWYVVRDSLFDQQLFVPWPIDGLVLNEELFSRIDRKKWKGIDVFELPIVDEPLDGIDEIPNDLVIGGSR